MSKFFLQLLLSIMLGVSAAIGLNPHAREKVYKTWNEATVFVHDKTQAAFETVQGVKIQPKVSADASLEAQTKTKISTDAISANTKLEAGLGTDLEAGARLKDGKLKLGSELESATGLNLGFDK
jgi:hypothetical protein